MHGRQAGGGWFEANGYSGRNTSGSLCMRVLGGIMVTDAAAQLLGATAAAMLRAWQDSNAANRHCALIDTSSHNRSPPTPHPSL